MYENGLPTTPLQIFRLILVRFGVKCLPIQYKLLMHLVMIRTTEHNQDVGL